MRPANAHVSKIKPMALIVSALLFHPGQAAGETSNWYLLENSHFRALSDAPKEQSVALLTDLENYREAVIQVVNIRVPAGAPKTPIILFRDRRRFNEYVPRGVAGVVMAGRKIGVVVMPANVKVLSEGYVIRHEYVHILSLNMPLRYPRWYDEGIAEVLSLAMVEPAKSLMTFGLGSGRQRNIARGIAGFNERLFDGQSRVNIRTDQYWYFWLVSHYLMLGRPDLRPNLERYLVARDNGEVHTVAFKRAFGKSLTQMWEDDIVPYTKTFPTFQSKIDFSGVDLDFKTRPAPPEVVGAAFIRLREYRGPKYDWREDWGE